MNKIEIGKKKYYYPSTWHELSRTQLIKILKIIYDPNVNKRTMRSQALDVLFPQTKSIIQKYGKSLFTDLERELQLGTFKYQLRKTVNFIFAPKAHKNILQQFTYYRKTYYLPGERLTGVTLSQWASAHLYLHLYTYQKQEHDFSKVLAALCLRKNEKFTTTLLESRSLLFHNLPIYLRNYLLIYIHTQWSELVQRFTPNIFPVSPENTHQEPDHLPEPYNWNHVIFSLAKTGAFGDVEKTAQVTLLTALLFIEKENIDIREHKNPETDE